MKTLAMALLLLGGAWAQEQAPSLAEVAKQKPAKKATRVVTNDEIPSKPAPEPAAEAKSAEGKPAEAEKAAAEEGKAAPDADLPEAVREAEKNRDSVRVQLGKTEDEISDLKARITEASDNSVRDGLVAQLDKKKQAAEDLKKKLDEAEEQVASARKAAGLPTGPQY